MALIECINASFGYDDKAVLTDVSFSVDEGDYLCIVGENGSGKSTLMKGILGIKKPLSGSVKYSDGLKSNEIGYLPQQTAVQKEFPASVFEVVLSGRLNSLGAKPFYSKADKKDAEQKLAMLGMGEFNNKCYMELSGGQQQRVLLARALCATKKLILLDEPVSGLDPVVTLEMYKLIKDINEKAKITVIMVSHDTAAAAKYSSHILHLGSEMLFYGLTSDYINTPLGKKFLGGEDDA